MKFSVVAFDLDGTLYPESRLNVRLVPFFLKDLRLLLAMGKARASLRESGAYDGDFYETQARLMADVLNMPVQKVREKAERLIYRGWEPLFKKIRPFAHVKETLEAFRVKGIRMGLLSDFPPETKLEHLKLSGFWETVICSEIFGRLKPDPSPFFELARKLGTPPDKILYVGNSIPYDVGGARKAGMKTALIRTGWKKLSAAAANSGADFEFYDYRQLRDYVLS